ncbi:MAG: transposase [Dolichospermum sp. WA123]|nr:transposase [Dolichospermum sp. WA123]
MRISYQYKIKPNKEQAEKIDKTLEMLRYQYNYLLAQRFHWYEQNRSPIDRCSIFVCYLPELKDQPNYYSQKASLTQLKKDRPWYKDIHSQVLQEVPKKVELAFERWLKGDINGKKSGRPRFKGVGQYKTFTFPQFKQHHFVNNKITLSKIGDIKVIVHRQIPDGFDIKTVSVTKKADGYYVTLSLDDKTVPTIKPDFNANNIVGIDVGLIDFIVTSDDERIAAKSINDAGWGQFISILTVKAENAGLAVIAVNPNGTSQECSSCDALSLPKGGHKVKKPLSQRTHNCPNCKVSLCRDLNASINIKNRGTHGLKAQSMSS